MDDKLDLESLDIKQDKIELLKKAFPEVVTEGKVDFERLKNELGEEVETGKERYEMKWPGKAYLSKIIQEPSIGTLNPVIEASVDFDTTENLFIEGDSLEVLKLLQKSYYGKVKMIYIDPPYNTGNDFVYPDNYSESLDTYLRYTGQKGEEGLKLTTNAETEGRYHSKWMSMIYPRLFLARNLLKEDGVIFISIDDHEADNLKKICNEIYGEENFINLVSINMKNVAGASGGGEDKRLKKNIEYLLIYTKNYDYFNSFNNAYDYTSIDELVKTYEKEGISWKYTSVLVSPGDKEYIGSTLDGEGNEIKIYARSNFIIKSIKTLSEEENLSQKEVYYKYAESIFQTAMPQSSIRPRVIEKVRELDRNDELYSIEYVPKTGRNKGKVYEQLYKGGNFRLFAWLKDVSEVIDGVLYKKELQGTYWDFARETKNLSKEGDISFPNGKKPLKMLMRMISMLDCKDEIVLDFFAGSATTAHAVLELNKNDKSARKFIMVQLPETIVENTDARNDGLNNVAKIGEERIRRVIRKIKEENEGKLDFDGKKMDLGFKVFRLEESNFKIWDKKSGEPLPQQLQFSVGNIRDNRSDEDIMYEIILKSGFELSIKVEKLELSGKSVYSIDDKSLLVCLEKELSQDFIKEIAEMGGARVVILDRSFDGNDELKTNTVELMKAKGIDFKTV